MRPAVRLPGMRRAFSPCPPDRARLPHHVARSASGRRKVRAQARRITRRAAIPPSVREGETCQDESVSASLTESRVASSLKHRRAASGYCASAMLGGPNRVAADDCRHQLRHYYRYRLAVFAREIAVIYKMPEVVEVLNDGTYSLFVFVRRVLVKCCIVTHIEISDEIHPS